MGLIKMNNISGKVDLISRDAEMIDNLYLEYVRFLLDKDYERASVRCESMMALLKRSKDELTEIICKIS
jgi:hypothetical protein